MAKSRSLANRERIAKVDCARTTEARRKLDQFVIVAALAALVAQSAGGARPTATAGDRDHHDALDVAGTRPPFGERVLVWAPGEDRLDPRTSGCLR